MKGHPNILIIYTDQQRWDALGASGNSEIQTPNLDRLASESVYFKKCFVQNPVCMPSRISFFSGQYPSRLGIPHMAVPVPEDVPLLTHMLGSAGYFCANIGKLHFLPHANRDHREIHPSYGFDHLEISDEPGCYEDAYRAWVRRKAPEELGHISLGVPPAAKIWQEQLNIEDGVKHPEKRVVYAATKFPGRDDITHSAFVGERTVDFLEAQTGRPFLCVSGFYSPHPPLTAPQKYLDLYDPETLSVLEYPADWNPPAGKLLPDAEIQRKAKHGYYALVSEVDDYVGRILASLDRTGLSENTIVIFTSDHGEWLGTRGQYGKDYYGDDAVSRVPLLIRFPKSWNISPRIEEGLAESVDVLPTLLEAIGLPVPPSVQGRSLWPVIHGERGSRDSVLMEGSRWKGLRTERYHYLMHADGRESLFDLQSDPMEYRDISTSVRIETIAELRAHLLRRMMEMERPLSRVWPY